MGEAETNPSTRLPDGQASLRVNRSAAIQFVEFDVEALIELHRGQIRRREYAPLGRLNTMMLAPSVGLNEKNNPLTSARYADTGGEGPLQVKADRVPLKLEWRGVGPLVALSKDSQDILIVGRCPHPPKLPPYDWVPPVGWAKTAKLNERGVPMMPKPPMIEQRLRDRASGVLAGRKLGMEFLVIQPVTQLLVVLPGKCGLATVACSADFSGRHTAFLYDPKREEGYLLFGLKEVTHYTA
jgi:hypothetical protein